VKEPDLAFIPVGPDGLRRDFPSVVLESGWESTGPRLVDERYLWHEGSGGRIRVVILLKFHRTNVQNKVSATLEISYTNPPGTVTTGTYRVHFLLPGLGALTYHLLTYYDNIGFVSGSIFWVP